MFRFSTLIVVGVIAAGFGVVQGVEEATCEADGTCRATSTRNGNCQDETEECVAWASQGECDANPNYMLKSCKKSCFVCGTKMDPDLPADASDLGVAQRENTPGFSSSKGEYTKRITRARRYMEATEVTSAAKAKCTNNNEDCTNWALNGECDTNQVFMKKHCGPACFSCEYVAFEMKCPMNAAAETGVWQPGDLGRLFSKLTSEPYLSKYSAQALSKPPEGPWVIQLDNVLSKEEADIMIELGAVVGYERSADVGLLKADGKHDSKVSGTRTSTNAWCLDDCWKSSTAQTVVQRLSNLTDIPDINSEYLQLLRYEPGQFYGVHHDYIAHHTIRQQGVRILTFYLYLNDVEAGGGTNFDKLNITVMPKVGRAIVWPSVLDEAPHLKDDRTSHQALPVEKGIKYGANAWYHQRDFKGPFATSCH